MLLESKNPCHLLYFGLWIKKVLFYLQRERFIASAEGRSFHENMFVKGEGPSLELGVFISI